MFQPSRASHVKRLSFASKLFPTSKSAFGLDISRLKTDDQFNGDMFCGGRSKNKDLLSFFGFIKDMGSGNAFITQLPMFRRSVKKLTALVEQELELAGAQEILLPLLVPQKLWEQSGRLKRQQAALKSVYQLSDAAGLKLIIGPTFEESVTQLMRSLESLGQHQLPVLLYQTSRKYRYEPNPRFGLLRSNEFLMNDLYTFDASLHDACQTYDKITSAYDTIFRRLGLNCIKTQALMGDIGGKHSHEYHLIVESGEDTIFKCSTCHQASNAELHQPVQADTDTAINPIGGPRVCSSCNQANLEKHQSLELGHAFLLSDTYSKPMKAKFTSSANERLPFEMGCFGLGLSRILGAGIDLLSLAPDTSSTDSINQQQEQDDQLLQIRWPNQVEPYTLGIVAPARRSQQYNAGSSDFIKNLTERILGSTSNVDIIVEDKDKEGIGKRLKRLQSLGIPNILVVGRKFLEETPQVELLELNSDKREYSQTWLTSDQICDYAKRLDDKLVDIG